VSEVSEQPFRPQLSDLAARAGVSLATVDRVINRRKGVKERTRRHVLSVARDIGLLSAEDLAAFDATRPPNIVFLLPSGSNPYLRLLGEMVRARVAQNSEGAPELRCFFIEGFDPAALADALRRNARWADGIAFFGLDHPDVREAVSDVARAGTQLVSIVSDLGHPGVSAYVGMENRGVGRSAGYLLGRFVTHKTGAVALVAGSRHYRAHSEREAGFLSIQEELFPHLRVVGMREGHDDSGQNYRHTVELLEQHPDLVGIYNVGGSSGGIARALSEHQRHDIVFIGHGLTPDTRRALLQGTLDVVFNTDPAALIDRAIAAIRSPEGAVPPIKLDIVLRENLPPSEG
jgi:LacI family transcriptional regulator